MKLRTLLSALALVALSATSASAALTSSEKAQVKGFIVAARPADAGRVRALVARTDLSHDESVAALSEVVAKVPFTAQRGAFLRELVFGPASKASRPLLAESVVRALVARADEIYRRQGAALDHQSRATSELVAIYGFVDHEIANAGKPTPTAHDPSAGIPKAAYEACSAALSDHVKRNARWLKGSGAIPPSVAPVRAQAQVALADMMPDGVTRHVDAADRLGLKGPHRQMLTDWGVLFEDAGKLHDDEAAKVRDVLARLPGARTNLELVFVTQEPAAKQAPIRARGLVVRARAGKAAAYPFPDEIKPGPWDAAVSPIAGDLAAVAAKRALDNRGELRVQAERDAAAAHGDEGRLLGRPSAPSVDHVVGAAVHLLMVDAPRAVDLAFVRFVAGAPESAAILSDAVGALAAFAPKEKSGPKIDVGGGKGQEALTKVRLAPNGVATAFSLGGHSWTMIRKAPSFAVTAVRRDGKAVTLADLPTARTPLRASRSWSGGGFVFAPLRGAPRAGIAPASKKTPAGKRGPTVTVVGTAAKGYDAVATPAPGPDLVVEGDLGVRGAAGGLAVRAGSGRASLRGAMLIVTPGGRTALLTRDAAGKEALLAAPIEPSPAMPVHVKLSVKGTKIEATVGKSTLRGTLPASMNHGDVALVAKRGATVELAGLSLKKR